MLHCSSSTQCGSLAPPRAVTTVDREWLGGFAWPGLGHLVIPDHRVYSSAMTAVTKDPELGASTEMYRLSVLEPRSTKSELWQGRMPSKAYSEPSSLLLSCFWWVAATSSCTPWWVEASVPSSVLTRPSPCAPSQPSLYASVGDCPLSVRTRSYWSRPALMMSSKDSPSKIRSLSEVRRVRMPT